MKSTIETVAICGLVYVALEVVKAAIGTPGALIAAALTMAYCIARIWKAGADDPPA